MDPPIFGLAKKGEAWKLNRDLEPLIKNVLKILDPNHHFFVLNTYSPQLPLSKLEKLLSEVPTFPKRHEKDILGLVSNSGKELPLGNLVRFQT